MILDFQTGDPIFAAACASLGMPCRFDPMEHKPTASAKRNQLYKTWHIARSEDGAHDPRSILEELSNGNLAQTAPAHPIFSALAAIESYAALAAHPSYELSLVPFFPTAFRAKTNRICTLRPPRQNDGRLNHIEHTLERKIIRMVPQYAAVAAVCGFRFYSTIGEPSVLMSDSVAFPGLSILQLVEWFNHFASMANAGGIIHPGSVTVAHTLPGFPPGEHPAHYALTAIRIFQAYSQAQAPTRFLFTGTFSALVPTKLDPSEQDRTLRFLTQGGSALL